MSSSQPKQDFMHAGWNTGICECFSGPQKNPGFFFLSCLCGGVAQGVLAEDLGLVDSFYVPSALYLVVEAFSARMCLTLPLANLRHQMSQKLGREESCLSSILLACCCYPCSLAQLQRDANLGGYQFTKSGLVPACIGMIPGDVRAYTSVPPAIVNSIEPTPQNLRWTAR